jgi:hypothetical protein
MSLLRLPRSVGWFLDLNGERKEVHEWNASGTREDRYGLRWVCTYGKRHPGRVERNVVGRSSVKRVWAYGTRYGFLYGTENLPRSTNWEMQPRNRSCSRICKLWEQLRELGAGRFKYYSRRSCEVCCVCHIMFRLDGLFSFGYASSGNLAVGCWLADLNTTVDGLAKGTLSVILGSLEKKRWSLECGRFRCLEAVLRLGKCKFRITGFETNLLVGVLRNSRFVGFRGRVCI